MSAVTFADHEGFQKTVLRATVGTAVAGLAVYGLEAAGLPMAYTLAPLACAAAAGSACGKTWRGRILYGILGGLCGAVPFAFLQYPIFGLALAGAGVGALVAHFRQKESGTVSEVGQPRMGTAAYVAAALLSALALVAGTSVVDAFTAHRLLEAIMPAPLAAMASTAVIGFFLALGSAGAHVVRDPDPVEKLYARMLPELSGDLKVLAARAMTNYRRCAEILEGSEAGYARSQLSKSLSDVTQRILELGRRWQAIDHELGERAESEINQRLSELKTLKQNAKDEMAKRQLGVAEKSLNAELLQLDRIRRGRERVVARLHGEMAQLERARFALLGLKTSDAHLRTAELSALSESLSSVAREMDCEAEAVDEIISKVVDVRGEGELPAAEAVVPQPVTPIAAPEAGTSAPEQKIKS